MINGQGLGYPSETRCTFFSLALLSWRFIRESLKSEDFDGRSNGTHKIHNFSTVQGLQNSAVMLFFMSQFSMKTADALECHRKLRRGKYLVDALSLNALFRFLRKSSWKTTDHPRYSQRYRYSKKSSWKKTDTRGTVKGIDS